MSSACLPAVLLALFAGCGGSAAEGRDPEPSAPLTDSDGDTIPDVCDECPDEPENFNHCLDWDGCPEHCYSGLDRGRIVILERLTFAPDATTLDESAGSVLDQVAAVFEANAELTRVACAGAGADALGAERARVVCDALVARGVAPARLEARGETGDDPIVRFVVLEAEGQTQARYESDAYVEIALPETPMPEVPRDTALVRDARGCPAAPE